MKKSNRQKQKIKEKKIGFISRLLLTDMANETNNINTLKSTTNRPIMNLRVALTKLSKTDPLVESQLKGIKSRKV